MTITREQIIALIDAEMAEYLDAAYADYHGARDQLERFAALIEQAVRQDEREQCAKVADEADKYNRFVSRQIAAAIRARGQQ